MRCPPPLCLLFMSPSIGNVYSSLFGNLTRWFWSYELNALLATISAFSFPLNTASCKVLKHFQTSFGLNFFEYITSKLSDCRNNMWISLSLYLRCTFSWAHSTTAIILESYNVAWTPICSETVWLNSSSQFSELVVMVVKIPTTTKHLQFFSRP